MKKAILVFTIIGVLLTGLLPLQTVSAQFQQGGVDHPGEWHVGEGLKQGDFFSYELCFVDYKECADFQMDLWIEGDVQSGSETKWVAQVVVYDGNKIVKGHMELGKVAPEPTGGSAEIAPYRSAFKSSIVWLSAFATADNPKAFSAPSWGKIGNIGGEQVVPKELLPSGMTTFAGHFDEVILVGWRTGGANSEIHVVDGLPFPIKASTWTHVSEGIPPQEYKFQILDYKENVSTNPFTNIVDSQSEQENLGCPNYESLDTSIKKPTKNFAYQVHVFYGPEFPVDGCPMKWQIKFISKFDDTEFLNQVQYDLLVVDDNLTPLRSIAQDEGRPFLYSPSGQTLFEMTVEEGPGTANYVVWIYGLAPEYVVPSDAPDYLQIPITIASSGNSPIVTPPVVTPPPATAEVPAWVKTSAGFWVGGATSDDEFVSAIQYLIKEGIIVVPPTSAGSSSSNDVTAWIKTTTGYWVDGVSSDNEFVSAIQFLIKEGIIVLS